MPDPDLTSTACDGETSTAQVGVDETSLTPNKRLVVVKRDNRTIVNDDAIAAGTNNGDLPGGLKLNICNEVPEIPAAHPIPAGLGAGNMLRVKALGDGSDCGVVVAAPLIDGVGTSVRVALAQNNVVTDDPVTVDGPLIQTVQITNNDSVKRLFSLRGRFSVIIQIDDDNEDSEGQFIMRSKLNADAAFPGTASPDPFIGGGVLNSRVVTFTYPGGPYGGRTLNDQREFNDEVILDPGVTRFIHYYTSTIRTMNVLTPGSSSPFRGVNVVGLSIRSEQVRES